MNIFITIGFWALFSFIFAMIVLKVSKAEKKREEEVEEQRAVGRVFVYDDNITIHSTKDAVEANFKRLSACGDQFVNAWENKGYDGDVLINASRIKTLEIEKRKDMNKKDFWALEIYL